MTEESAHPIDPAAHHPPGANPFDKTFIERALEGGIFAARWIMAPFYIGLCIALAAMMIVFVRELAHYMPQIFSMTTEDAILMALSLIDLSLSGNLMIIVIFSGYENFVSKIDTGAHIDRPSWMGSVDFSGLKIKLIASIVAISGIALLKAFLGLTTGHTETDVAKLMWLVLIHLTFVISGVLLALMDWLTGHSKRH
jgi:uncharacterized protein (TIGR00645 family)